MRHKQSGIVDVDTMTRDDGRRLFCSRQKRRLTGVTIVIRNFLTGDVSLILLIVVLVLLFGGGGGP